MPVKTFDVVAANDGYGFTTDTVWPPSTTAWADDSSFPRHWAYKALTNNEVDVMTLRWDTSSLSGLTITAAKFRFFIQATYKFDTDGRNLVADYYDYGGSPQVVGDYAFEITPDAFSVDITTLTDGAWNEVSLTSPDANINKSGFTGIRVGCSGTGVPTGGNGIAIVSYEGGIASQLIVTHDPIIPPVAWLRG